MSSCVIFIVLYIITQTSFCLQEDYYWREYTSIIPADAIVGGQDINNKNIYIGQAYVHDAGLIMCEIFPGVQEVRPPMFKIQNINKNIKILFGSQKDFYWERTNSTHIHLQLIGKRPVIGGHEDGGKLYIARINLEGKTKIGKIPSYNVGNALMYYEHEGQEKHVSSYEVLLYQNVYSCQPQNF